MKFALLLLLLACAGCRCLQQQPVSEPFDPSHEAYDGILREVVRDGRVDYAALRQRSDLRAYLDQLAAVPEKDFAGWENAAQLAFLINLYNATTLQLVADHYPVRSIRDIGGLVPPWKLRIVRIFGRKTSLDDLEHRYIRQRFQEPATHFALVCGAKSCPPLRREAYSPERLRAQLQDQAKGFLADTEKNSVSAKSARVSPIFRWYAKDFERASGSVEQYLAPLLPGGQKPGQIEYSEYDWSLNDQAVGQPKAKRR